MTDSYTPISTPPPPTDEHVPRLGDVRVLRLTRAQFDAYENPVSSGLYPGLKTHPFILITDEDVGEGIFAESYPPGPGIELDTNATWLDGKNIWKITYTAGSLTPGVTGTALTSSLPVIDTLVRTEGYANLANNGAEGWIELGGSGFAMTVRDDRKLILTGPASITIYKVHVTLWYTK
jgi:hypothetical protein